MNSPTIVQAPGNIFGFSSSESGVPSGTAKCIMIAGTNQFTREGTNKTKNCKNSTCPFCQTIKVVISPNGLNAPPALAAITIFIQPITTNARLSAATAITTVAISSAVVKLSAIGDKQNEITPVIQKIFL